MGSDSKSVYHHVFAISGFLMYRLLITGGHCALSSITIISRSQVLSGTPELVAMIDKTDKIITDNRKSIRSK